jgi:glucokinase
MKKRERTDYLVGVDVGGSKTMAGVFTPDLKLLQALKVSTKAHRGTDQVIQRIIDCIRDVVDSCGLRMAQIESIGVGTPGVVEPRSGTVVLAPNLHWKNVRLRSRLAQALRRPVAIENDSKAAMIGIHEVELKSKPRHAVGIFLGTGIGGALVLNGSIFGGVAGVAGEVGHMVLSVGGPTCGCGKHGCFEVFASRTGMVARLAEAVKKGERTILKELLQQERRERGVLRSGSFRKAIKSGDKLAARIVHEAAEYTGIAIADLIHMLSPEIVVLGGGVIGALEKQMMPVIRRTARAHSLLRFVHEPKIVATQLGDHAGVTGAAAIARDHRRRPRVRGSSSSRPRG